MMYSIDIDNLNQKPISNRGIRMVNVDELVEAYNDRDPTPKIILKLLKSWQRN